MVNCVLLLCCSRVVHLRSLVIVGFDASDEERLTGRQSLHEGVQRLTKLTAKCWHMFIVVNLRLQE